MSSVGGEIGEQLELLGAMSEAQNILGRHRPDYVKQRERGGRQRKKEVGKVFVERALSRQGTSSMGDMEEICHTDAEI